MSDLEEARRLLRTTEAREIKVYGCISPMLSVQLSAGWVAIASAAIDEAVWGDNHEA